LQNRLDEESADGYISTSKNNRFYVAAQPTQIKSASDSLWKSNNGRYSSTNPDIRELRTPKGELYGFAYKGEIYLDETKMSPQVPIHEYTHLWDGVIQHLKPKLWARGKELMKQTTLWKEISESEYYGKKWQAQGKTAQEIEDLIASEVHARLVGEDGERILDELAEKQGDEGIIDKLVNWLKDFWKGLAQTFGTWSQEDIDAMTLDQWNKLALRDFTESINPITEGKRLEEEQAREAEAETTSVAARKEREKEGYPEGVRDSKAARAVWDILSDEQKKRIAALPAYNRIDLLPHDLDHLYLKCKGKTNKIKQAWIEEIISDLEDYKPRQAEQGRYEPIDLDEELRWLQKTLP